MNQHDSVITSTPEPDLPVWFRLDHLQNDTTWSGMNIDTLSSASSQNTQQKHFFTGSTVKILPDPPVQRPRMDQDWLYGSFAILLLMIVVLRLTWPRHINQLLRAIIFPMKDSSEGRLFQFRFDSFSVIFMLIYGMSYSLLLLSLLKDMQWIPQLHPQESAVLFFVFIPGFIGLIGMKWLMASVSASIFGIRQQAAFYKDHLLMSGFVSAALIIPLVVINAFSSSLVFLFIALVIMTISESFRLIRSFHVATGLHGFSYVHIILYFCTLETVPLIIAGKIILISQMM